MLLTIHFSLSGIDYSLLATAENILIVFAYFRVCNFK